jgi:hypothetical protein
MEFINANKFHRKSGDVGRPSIGYAERVLALAYSWEEADGSPPRINAGAAASLTFDKRGRTGQEFGSVGAHWVWAIGGACL